MVRNWLYEGRVYHERLKPFNHKFFYSLFYIKFPISKINELKGALFSLNKWNIYSLYSKDYLDGSDKPLEEKIKKILSNEDVDTNGEIMLHTMPRLFGFGFNPVSFWYVYNKQGKEVAILSEVNSTFGDRHYYLLQGFDQYRNIPTKKVLHVSPFFDVKGEYHFSFTPKTVAINYFDEEKNDYFLKSSISEVAQYDFTTKNLLKLLIRFPLMTFMVVYRIHWQAFKLYFLKKAIFYRQPIPPIEILTKEIPK